MGNESSRRISKGRLRFGMWRMANEPVFWAPEPFHSLDVEYSRTSGPDQTFSNPVCLVSSCHTGPDVITPHAAVISQIETPVGYHRKGPGLLHFIFPLR